MVGTCALGFVLGLSMCCSAGIYMFTLIDETCASWNILIFALLEVTTVAWLYGVDRFLGDIEEMGMRLPTVARWYWKTCWTGITPTILAILVVWKFATLEDVKYAGEPFPAPVQVLGLLIGFSSVIFLPLLAVRQVLKRRASGKPLGAALWRPTPKWLPAKKA